MGGEVKLQPIGDKPIQPDLIQRLAIEDLVSGSIHVRPDVVDQPVLRHRIAVVGDACEVVK